MLRNLIKCILIISTIIVIIVGAPFFSFGKKSYESICADAAKYYGIDEGEYIIHITKGKISFAAELISGTYNLEYDENDRRVYVINIEKSVSRPMTIETIFHEFAHAAQNKYNMDYGNYNREQHAELMAFNAMWRSNYWYNALHMLEMHSFHLKPKEYLCAAPLWKSIATGQKTVNF
jgi:hypothetical protein